MQPFLHRIIIVASFASPVLLGTPGRCESPTDAFRCEGPFARNTSYDVLVRTFGARQIATEEVNVGGDTIMMSIVFPSNVRRRIALGWRDAVKRRGLERAMIEGQSAWSVSGVAIGMPLVDVERLNGRPFKIMYFEGDYGGYVADWLGGG